MAMEKRQPLSVLIGLQANKLRGGEKPSGDDDADPDADKGDDDSDPRYDDDGMVAAAEDAIDAMKNRDGKALNTALCHWFDMYMSSHGDDDSDKN